MIDAYATETITITPKGTLDPDGTYDFDGTAVETKAVVIEKAGILRRAEGEEYNYNKVVLLKRGETVAIGDHITHDSTNHEVMEVGKYRGLGGGLRAYKVFLQ
jgi:hypothetical protein